MAKIESRNTFNLRDHPLIAHIPGAGAAEARLAGVLTMVQEGRARPILITERNQIIDPDSRDVYHVIKENRTGEYQVEIVPEGEVATRAVETLFARQHYTQSARAYLVWPMLADAVAESTARKIENLKNPNVSRKSSQNTIGETAETLAESFGICRNLLFQAKKLHAAFAENEELREKFEGAIIAGEIGLGAAIAGIAGRKATLEVTPENGTQLELWRDVGHSFAVRARKLCGLEAGEIAQAKRILTQQLSDVPVEVLDIVEAAIKAARKQAEQAVEKAA